MSGDLWDPIFSTDDLIAATDGAAWVRAMLETEVVLAESSAARGVVPNAAAREIAESARTLVLDPSLLGVEARRDGNPVIPLVSKIRDAVSADAAQWVHWGATSQDILDTAGALIATRACTLVRAHLSELADGCATLVEVHGHTLMLARTLLQPALPTTFGAKAAGWLVSVLEARRLVDDASSHLSVSLGGAAGTLAAFEAEGPAVLTEFAERLDLAKPLVPWHTSRQRVASLGAALATAAGTAAKITGDIALLMQAEVAEVAVTQPGGSSTLPHKRNPVAAALTDAAARRSAALASVLVSSVVSEHERPLGAWHAEWVPFAELLALSGGAVANAAATVSRLEIFPEAMKANVERIGPVLLSERMMFALTALVGRNMAVSILADATASSDFAAAVAQDPRVAGVLAADRLAELLDPLGYLGATGTWVAQSLAAYRREEPLP